MKEEFENKKKELFYSGTGLHIIVVTLNCNMKCVYCQVSSKCSKTNRYDMDLDTAKKTVDLIFQSPSKEIDIEIQGGEPLLNFDIIPYIYSYAVELTKKYNKDMYFHIVTNLTLMNEDIFNWIVSNKIGMCTSLDGPEELHNYNRKFNTNNYKTVEYWIKRFKENGVGIFALSTITRASLTKGKEIVDTYRSLGIHTIHLRKLSKLGMAQKQWDKIGYTPEEYLKFWKDTVDYIYSTGDITERMVEIMRQKLRYDEPNYVDLRSPCGAVLGQLAYMYDGNVYPCDEARMIGKELSIGHVDKDSYTSILQNPLSQKIIKASLNTNYDSCNKCQYQEFCGVCPVCQYAQSKEFTCFDDEYCKVLKEQFEYSSK